MSSTSAASPLDFHACVPFGADLRVLLNSDVISPGVISDLLKEKGVFIYSSDKKVTVPLLSSTLLTPPEFLRLIEVSVNKELVPKVRTTKFELTDSKSDWLDTVRNGFDGQIISTFADSANGNVEIATPTITVPRAGSLKIGYKLFKVDISQDWIKRKVEYSGEIHFKQKEGSKILEVDLSRTSKETDEVNRRILKHAATALKKEDMIKQEDGNKITFGSLQDYERVLFFKRLTAGTGVSLELGTVNDMEIGRDKGMPELPDDPRVSWLNQSVRRLEVDGDRLNDIFLISDDSYYRHYYVQRMDVTFRYAFGPNSGETRISFHFTSCKPDDRFSAEFEFEVLGIKSTSGRMNVDSKRDLNNQLKTVALELIHREYEAIIAARRDDL
jgi:hypothetical protein